MTALKGIGIILLIFLLIGFLRVGALLRFGQELNLRLSVGPFRFTLLPAKEKKATAQEAAKTKKEEEKRTEKKKRGLPKLTKKRKRISSPRHFLRSENRRGVPASAFVSTRWRFLSSLAAATRRRSRRPMAMQTP